jgi:valyl-tRNA synthetase
MDTITKPALENVMNDTINLIPSKFKNTYHHWMANVRDWCISRQLWWGHRIPAWYDDKGDYVVAKTEEDAIKLYRQKNPSSTLTSLKQETDVMDTWFSSWLWPMAVFDTSIFKDSKNNKGNTDLNYYYPTNDLVTAPEILFFWVARMIISGYEYRGKMPFKNVYLTGIVRDKLGRKMSKSLGNSPDPLELITKYGADGVRTGMLFSSPAGNDLPFDEKLCEQGRNFANKIWNAFRLVKGWETYEGDVPETDKVAITWFESRFNQALIELEDHYAKFRISDALLTTYKLIWDDFCAWYLEMVKPEFGKPIHRETLVRTIDFFERILKVLHPFMPFITEELWHELKDRDSKDCLIVSSWPQANKLNEYIITECAYAFEIIGEIRNFRNGKGLSPKESLNLIVKSDDQNLIQSFWPIINKLSNLNEISFTSEKVTNASGFVIKSTEFFIPLDGKIDAAKERESILKELDYQRGFLASVDKKLSNEKFVNSAPAQVIEMERKKKQDAEMKIKSYEEALKNLL